MVAQARTLKTKQKQNCLGDYQHQQMVVQARTLKTTTLSWGLLLSADGGARADRVHAHARVSVDRRQGG